MALSPEPASCHLSPKERTNGFIEQEDNILYEASVWPAPMTQCTPSPHSISILACLLCLQNNFVSYVNSTSKTVVWHILLFSSHQQAYTQSKIADYKFGNIEDSFVWLILKINLLV